MDSVSRHEDASTAEMRLGLQAWPLLISHPSHLAGGWPVPWSPRVVGTWQNNAAPRELLNHLGCLQQLTVGNFMILIWLRVYSETCFHIHRLFPKGGHQHWFFGHDADFAAVTYEFLGFGIFVPCRCPDRVAAQLPQFSLAARLPWKSGLRVASSPTDF